MEISDTSHQNYASPKITLELQKVGEGTSDKTVGNYMHQIEIKAQWSKPYIQTTIDSDFTDQLKIFSMEIPSIATRYCMTL